jgi:hypothetical protein
MQKLLFTMFAILATSLLSLSVVVAEPTHPNEVGLYLSPDGYGATGTFEVMVPVTVYLVLTKPTDVQNGGAPYNNIYGFECQLNFNPNPFGNLFKLLDNLPSVSINVGDSSDINQGFLEYVVGIADSNPLAVVDEAAVLITFTFMAVAPNPFVVTLGPPGGYSSIPGQMAFYPNDQYSDDAQVMYSVGGSHESPVFIFNGEAVAVETETFGSVKALYR